MGRPNPTVASVEELVAAVRTKGLDGIAITDHYTKTNAYRIRDIVDQHFGGEILIIPGQEISRLFPGTPYYVHVVELYLTPDTTFRFIAHPGHPWVRDLSLLADAGIHGIELKNPNYDHEMDEPEIRQMAEKHDLMLLTNSDAHTLTDIGRYYNHCTPEELLARAARGG